MAWSPFFRDTCTLLWKSQTLANLNMWIANHHPPHKGGGGRFPHIFF